MNVIIFLIILIEILQFIFCHFSLWFVLSTVARILFCMRILGVTFKIRHLWIVEGVACACMLLWNMLFAGDHFPFLRFGLYCLFTLISCFLMFLDDALYVYVTKDEEE